ncbi:MAG: citrate/2-methylcitrate synthase, partial [Gammaproteobacteria bacterium]|nr:citrate/2-methylcitrate synthase [Gammaproteobacteria bacterium]
VQLLQIDHSFNAGTFASRVIGSTMAPVTAVLSGAVGALSGVLHGGADEAALSVAREVGSPENAEAYVDRLLSEKGRLMGMGHREYRTVDPRSLVLKPLARELCLGSDLENEFKTLLAIEEVFNRRMAERGKDVWANVEYYKGVVLEALGIEPAFFTTMFAMARTVGWLAHFMESRVNNRIIRPAAMYVGPEVSAA